MKIRSHLIKELRIAKGWSQEQLSEIAGLSLRTIQRLENGGNAAIESIRALATALDIAPDDLIATEKKEKPTPIDAVRTGLLQFANFSDRATRFEYWWFFLFVLLVTAMATIIHEKVSLLVGVLLLLPFIAAGTRRLNDIGRSGWWQLFFLVPFGQVVVFYMLAQAPVAETPSLATHNPL